MELYIIVALSVVLLWVWIAGAFSTITLTWEGDETVAFMVFMGTFWPVVASIGMALAVRDMVRRW